MTLSRRSAIKLGLGAGPLPLLGRPPFVAEAEAAAPGAGAAAVVKARPLPLSAVRLLAGPLKHAQELDARYLLALEPDRMLAYYRDRAGLQPKAEPYGGWDGDGRNLTDRKSTRLNSSHSQISYAVFCLKKKKKRRN